MEKLHNLKERICSFENLLNAYNHAIKNKRYRDEVLSFGMNLEENLFDIQRDLLNSTYTVGHYREFYVRYPKPRLVMALGFRDRVVQWAIYLQINPFIDKRFYEHSYGCRPDKGTLAAAHCVYNWVKAVSRKPDAKEWVIVKGDIAKYFYRVDHDVVLDIYGKYTDDEWFLDLMRRIVNNPEVPFGLPMGMKPDECPRSERLFDVGMPIGNLTSQETANIYLNELDQYCKHVLRIHYYARYMDDFIILVRSRRLALDILDRIAGFLKEHLRLSLSPKCRILPVTAQFEFVGCAITPHGIRLRKKTTKHIKRSLKAIAARYASGEISFERAMNSLQCYMGMTIHVNGYNLRRWIAENIILTRAEPSTCKP